MEAAIDASIAPLTLRRYASAWGKYSAWCKDLGEEPLPVTEDKALAYVALLAKQGMKKGTVKYHLAGLRMAQIKAGMRAPDWSEMDRLTQLKKGLARLEAVGGNRGHAREPVREIHMRAMLDVWTSKGQRGTMLWAAACMCFFGCLRAGEALAPESGVFDRGAHLSWEDVQLDSDRSSRWIRVRIKESKTDRLREGAWVTLHRTDTALCPVKAVLRFMVDRGAGSGPFFKDGNGSGLTRRDFVAEVRRALVEKGLPEVNISGHSFRIGAATAASAGGASEDDVKALGRWRSREYRGYIRDEGGKQASSAKKWTERFGSAESSRTKWTY